MYLRSQTSHLTVRLAETEADLRAVQHLRYRVFVDEGGASGPDNSRGPGTGCRDLPPYDSGPGAGSRRLLFCE